MKNEKKIRYSTRTRKRRLENQILWFEYLGTREPIWMEHQQRLFGWKTSLWAILCDWECVVFPSSGFYVLVLSSRFYVWCSVLILWSNEPNQTKSREFLFLRKFPFTFQFSSKKMKLKSHTRSVYPALACTVYTPEIYFSVVLVFMGSGIVGVLVTRFQIPVIISALPRLGSKWNKLYALTKINL